MITIDPYNGNLNRGLGFRGLDLSCHNTEAI